MIAPVHRIAHSTSCCNSGPSALPQTVFNWAASAAPATRHGSLRDHAPQQCELWARALGHMSMLPGAASEAPPAAAPPAAGLQPAHCVAWEETSVSSTNLVAMPDGKVSMCWPAFVLQHPGRTLGQCLR